MKLIIILTVVACMHASAGGFAQKNITLSKKDVSLETIFREIKKQTGYNFLYNYEWLQQTKKVTIDVKNAPLEQVLNICFKDQPLTYEIVDKTISLKQKIVTPPLSIGTPSAFIDIHGKVLNEYGKAIAGVTVKVKGTSKATSTNDDGNFTLTGVDKYAVLIFTSVNIETFEVRMDGRTDIAVTLKTKISQLDETVVIAYGTTTQRLNTGSINTVKAEDIEHQPVANPIASLEGRVPGLQITQYTGVPGGNFKVQIRGQNSLRSAAVGQLEGNDPLYIIDGVPFFSTTMAVASTSAGIFPAGTSPLNSLNPADIESIEILKDADATAIYGSRGANGVILITTKRGKAGETKVNLNVYSGAGRVTRTISMLNTQQYLEMRNEAFQNDGVAPHSYDYDVNGTWDTTRYTDWQKALIGGTAKATDVQSSISGGNSNTQFLIGGGYHRETTVFPGDFSDQRASAHFSLNNNSTNKRFRTTLSVNYSIGNTYLLNGDLTGIALNLPPDAPLLHDSSGKLNWAQSTWNNPLAATKRPYSSKVNNLIGNAVLSYQLFPGVQMKSSFGYTNANMNALNKIPLSSQNPAIAQFLLNQTAFSSSYVTSWIIEPQITFQKNISSGRLDLLLGTTFQNQERSAIGQNGIGFSSEALMENILAANTIQIISDSYSKYQYNAFFGRINYNWKGKYLVNLTGRRDGSSRFGSGKQFANFGAAGVAWIFSNEDFIQHELPFLSHGKIRSSYGLTGSDQIGDYAFLDTYAPGGTYQNIVGLDPQRLLNPDFAWETNKKLEAALEFGFLKDRVLVTVVYYRNRSSNQLIGYALPPTTGFSDVQANFPATVQNTGIEVEVYSINIKKKDFTWSASVNLTIPRNKLLNFPNLAGSSYSNTYVVGEPLSIRKLYHWLGVKPSSGFHQVEDVDKDGAITVADMQTVKFLGQDYYGGIQNNFEYKGLKISFFLQFIKQSGRNFVPGATPGQKSNQPDYVMGRWQKPGDIANVQRFTQASTSAYANYRNSDAIVGDASFIRLKNISISYQLPQLWTKNLKTLSSRIYFQGQNILTFTNYKGLDPEQATTSSLPPLRFFTAGIQLTL